MLKAVAVREQKDEILVATEWCSVAGEGGVDGSGEEQREWMEWQLGEVQKWLQASGLDASERTILFTQSGELRLILIGDGLGSSNSNAYSRAFASISTPINATTTHTNSLIRLSQDLQFLPTMSPSQQVSFYSNLPLLRLPAPVIKHLLLPKCVSFRSTLLSLSTTTFSIEEVKVLYGPLSRSLCDGEGDFLALLGGLTEALLRGAGVSVGEAVLTQFLLLLAEWCSAGLIGGEWMTSCLVPQLMKIFTGAVSKSAVWQKSVPSQSTVAVPHSLLSHTAAPHSSGSAQLKFAVLTVLKGSIASLREKTLSTEVLRLLARGQGDAEPAIRRETLQLLDAVLERCSAEIRSKVAGPALCRALSDADDAVRGAGMGVLPRWVHWIGAEECAGRVGVVLLGRAGDSKNSKEAGEAIDAIERVIVPRLRAALSSKGGVVEGGVSNSATSTVGVSNSATITATTDITSNATSTANTSTTNNTSTKPTLTTASIPSTTGTGITSKSLNATPSNSKLRLGSIKKIT